LTDPPPYPGIAGALWLTLVAWLLVGVAREVALAALNPTAATGFGVALGLGVAGLLGASRIPPPHAARVGLRPLARTQLACLVLLIPSTLLASELDNGLRALLSPAEAARAGESTRELLGQRDALTLIEMLVVAGGLAPLAEEWFFRGVIQQGLVQRLGALRGVVLTATLFAFLHAGPSLTPAAWLPVVGAAFAHGLSFGALRLLTGSLLAPIVLHASINAVQIAALFEAERFPVAGFNAPGAHTPLEILLPAALSVALGFFLLARSAFRPSTASTCEQP
jgi:membrane protease YdiL (CAAX protease family)